MRGELILLYQVLFKYRIGTYRLWGAAHQPTLLRRGVLFDWLFYLLSPQWAVWGTSYLQGNLKRVWLKHFSGAFAPEPIILTHIVHQSPRNLTSPLICHDQRPSQGVGYGPNYLQFPLTTWCELLQTWNKCQLLHWRKNGPTYTEPINGGLFYSTGSELSNLKSTRKPTKLLLGKLKVAPELSNSKTLYNLMTE